MSVGRAVVFDIGGTLVQTGDYIERAYLAVFDRFGIPRERIELFKQFSGRAKHVLFEAVLDPAPDLAARVRSCMQLLEAVLVREAASLEAIPGAGQCLETLREERWLIAIATGFPRAAGEAILARFGWAYALVAGEDVQEHRPAPDPVLRACTLLGVTPAESIVVGDTPNDVLSAKAAGAASVAVTTGKFGPEELAAYGPKFILSSVAELPRLLSSGAFHHPPG